MHSAELRDYDLMLKHRMIQTDDRCALAPELSSKPAACRCCCRSTGQTDRQTDRETDRQTDGRTPNRYIDAERHTMRAAGRVTKSFLKLIHTATPDTTELSCLRRVRFCGVINCIPDIKTVADRKLEL